MFQERQDFIDNLNKFISSSKDSLNGILENLEWSRESIYSGCQETPEEKNTRNDRSDCGRDENTAIDQTEEKLENEVGSNPLYKELVESLSKPSTLKKNEKSRTEALVELLKMERDAKRRRINYKNRVHTKNKSHIEILREVLAEQMSTLSQHAEMENALETSEENESGKMEQSEELVEIRFPDGNPYLAWKKVLDMKSKLRFDSKQEAGSSLRYLDARNRDTYSDIDRFKDKRKELNRDRNKFYCEDRYSKYISSKINDTHSKYNHSSMDDEGRFDFGHRSSLQTSDSKYHSSRQEDKINDSPRYRTSSREVERSHGSYEQDTDVHRRRRHSSRHTDGDDLSSKRKEYYDEEGKSSRKYKRDHSTSRSPSRYKSKKHKSRHKRH